MQYIDNYDCLINDSGVKIDVNGMYQYQVTEGRRVAVWVNGFNSLYTTIRLHPSWSVGDKEFKIHTNSIIEYKPEYRRPPKRTSSYNGIRKKKP